MSPRSAALVPTASVVDGVSMLARQHGVTGSHAPVVLEQALAVGAPGWTRDHHEAAQQRQVEALAATRTSLGVPDAPLVTPTTAGAVLAGPVAPGHQPGSPTAAENAAIDALFDQAAHINVALLAFVLVTVAGVLALVLTRL